MNRTRNLQATIAAAAVVFGAACGSTSTENANDAEPITVPGDTVPPSTATPSPAAPSTVPPTTATPSTVPPTTQAPATTVAPPTTPAPTTTTIPAPPPSTIAPVLEVVPDSEDAPCGVFGDVPPTATIVSDLDLDINGDGTVDRLVSYLDGDWVLRAEISGLVTELVIDGVGAHSVEVLGLADVGEVTAGPEILATTGGGPSTKEIGIFSFAGPGCLLQAYWQTGEPVNLLVGGDVGAGNSTYCGEGWVASAGYYLEDDATYSAWGSAYEEKDVGVYGYIGASDDYSEGLAYDDLTPITFDCFGLTL